MIDCRPLLAVALGAALVGGTVGCESGGGDGAGPQSPQQTETAPEEPPPFRPPPTSGPERWQMPDLGNRDPAFPFLPGESRDSSRSIGGVVHGYLVRSKRFELPHPHLAFLDVQYRRGLFYTTDRLRQIVEEAARHLREYFPDHVVRLGNFGNPGGGDIPYSFSHNSGRDGDLAIIVENESGETVVPEDFVELDDDGTYEGDGRTLHFAVDKNWRLVEGLVRAAGHQLQYIFISNPLKEKLLDRAEAVGADRKVRRRARRILNQPGGSPPHDDHYHLRIYCSEVDVRSGCRDRGRKHPWYRSYADARRSAVKDATSALDADESEVRKAGARRLAMLRASVGPLAEALDDPAPDVRAAAARAVVTAKSHSTKKFGPSGLPDLLEQESHDRVYLEFVDALGRIGTARAVEALIGELDAVRTVDLPGEFEEDARVFVADALIRAGRPEPVEPLIGLLEADSADVRSAAAQALRYLTNHRFGADWRSPDEEKRRGDVEAWRMWFEKMGDRSRDAWLTAGFREAGYEVDQLTADDVWEMVRAIRAADRLSYNAQKELMRIADRYPESLSWSKRDASLFWRNWFDNRRWRYGGPPKPDDLWPE